MTSPSYRRHNKFAMKLTLYTAVALGISLVQCWPQDAPGRKERTGWLPGTEDRTMERTRMAPWIEDRTRNIPGMQLTGGDTQGRSLTQDLTTGEGSVVTETNQLSQPAGSVCDQSGVMDRKLCRIVEQQMALQSLERLIRQEEQRRKIAEENRFVTLPLSLQDSKTQGGRVTYNGRPKPQFPVALEVNSSINSHSFPPYKTQVELKELPRVNSKVMTNVTQQRNSHSLNHARWYLHRDVDNVFKPDIRTAPSSYLQRRVGSESVPDDTSKPSAGMVDIMTNLQILNHLINHQELDKITPRGSQTSQSVVGNAGSQGRVEQRTASSSLPHLLQATPGGHTYSSDASASPSHLQYLAQLLRSSQRQNYRNNGQILNQDSPFTDYGLAGSYSQIMSYLANLPSNRESELSNLDDFEPLILPYPDPAPEVPEYTPTPEVPESTPTTESKPENTESSNQDSSLNDDNSNIDNTLINQFAFGEGLPQGPLNHIFDPPVLPSLPKPPPSLQEGIDSLYNYLTLIKGLNTQNQMRPSLTPDLLNPSSLTPQNLNLLTQLLQGPPAPPDILPDIPYIPAIHASLSQPLPPAPPPAPPSPSSSGLPTQPLFTEGGEATSIEDCLGIKVCAFFLAALVATGTTAALAIPLFTPVGFFMGRRRRRSEGPVLLEPDMAVDFVIKFGHYIKGENNKLTNVDKLLYSSLMNEELKSVKSPISEYLEMNVYGNEDKLLDMFTDEVEFKTKRKIPSEFVNCLKEGNITSIITFFNNIIQYKITNDLMTHQNSRSYLRKNPHLQKQIPPLPKGPNRYIYSGRTTNFQDGGHHCTTFTPYPTLERQISSNTSLKFYRALCVGVNQAAVTLKEAGVTSNESDLTSKEPVMTSKEAGVTSNESVLTLKEPILSSKEPGMTSWVSTFIAQRCAVLAFVGALS